MLELPLGDEVSSYRGIIRPSSSKCSIICSARCCPTLKRRSMKEVDILGLRRANSLAWDNILSLAAP